MKLFFLLAIFAVGAGAQAPKPPVGVPADAKHFNGRFFKAILDPMTWHRAKEKCAALGGRLAVVPDAETWEFVRALSPAVMWLGATDEKTEGVWTWIDGTPMKFEAWDGKEPNNSYGREHYLATTRDGWNDWHATGKYPDQKVAGFVCEWPVKKPTGLAENFSATPAR